MKIIKFTILVGIFLLFALIISIVLVRRPSYTISTNGKLYIVNKLSSSISIFDLEKGKELKEIPISVEPHEITTMTDQKRVVVTNYGSPNMEGKSITIINTTTNEIEKEIDLGESLKPHGITNFPESDNVGVVTDISNELLVVNVETGVVEKKIPTQQKFSHLLVLHPKKPLAYASNINSNSVSVINLESNKVIKIIPCGLGAEGIDITPDGSEIWVSNNDESTIHIISTDNHQSIDNLKTDQNPSRLKFSIDGNHCLVTNAGGGTISVYNRNNRTHIKTISIPGKRNLLERVFYNTPRPVGIIMHPNGLYSFVANSNANKIEVVDMKTFTLVSTIGTGEIPDGLAIVKKTSPNIKVKNNINNFSLNK